MVAALLNAVIVTMAAVPTTPIRPAHGICVPGRVVSVHDGDTVRVEIKFEINVRLQDCWAPEVTGLEKPEGIKAADYARSLALNKPCMILFPARGDNIGNMTTLGRGIGWVWIDGMERSLNEAMVESGHAKRSK
jgi:endonuclease YncB( thermonuclease family)